MLTTTALLALFIGLQARPALGHSVLTSISIAGKVYPGWSNGLSKWCGHIESRLPVRIDFAFMLGIGDDTQKTIQ
jgi:hypothetical protein